MFSGDNPAERIIPATRYGSIQEGLTSQAERNYFFADWEHALANSRIPSTGAAT